MFEFLSFAETVLRFGVISSQTFYDVGIFLFYFATTTSRVQNRQLKIKRATVDQGKRMSVDL